MNSNLLKVADLQLPSRIIIIAALIVSGIYGSGCMNYYKVISREGGSGLNENKVLINQFTHVIIHFKDTAYRLNNARVKSDLLTGSIVPVNDIEVKYLHPQSVTKSRYLKKDENTTLNIVQIHAKDVSVPKDRQLTIPLSSITVVDMNEKNAGATTGSHLLGAGIILSVLVLVFGIVAGAALDFGHF